MTKHFLIIIISILFFSCKQEKGVHYQKFMPTPSEGWNSKDTLSFEFDVEDTTKIYDFWLSVRNDISYQYANIYMFVYTEFPNGKSSLDTMNYILAYPSGKWIGEVSGSLAETSLIYKHTRVPVSGRYKMNVIQAMRDEKLEGITDIGLKLIEAKPIKK